ncbi:hypothetical protein CLM74_06410 [Stenotrophomonas sp. MYb57]|nr:hypothetical protein CLM74_06410 [Stenotrophomonas sp. MYb57]
MIGIVAGSVEVLQVNPLELNFCQIVPFARHFTTALPRVNPPPFGAIKTDDSQRKSITWLEIADKSLAFICYTSALLVSCIGIRDAPRPDQQSNA